MKNQITLNSNTYHGFSLQDAVAGAYAAGIRYIELAAVRGYTEHVLPEMSEAELGAVKVLLADQGLTATGMCGHSNIMTPQGRENLIRNFDLAHRLGITVVATGTGETHDDEVIIEDESELVGILQKLCSEAQARGITLAIETHGANYSTGARINDLVEKVGVDNLGINYDTANVMHDGKVAPYDDLANCVDAVRWMHLKDSAGPWDEWNFPAIGDGDIDFSKILRILADAQCTAPLSIEVEFTAAGPASLQEVHDAVLRSAQHIVTLSTH